MATLFRPPLITRILPLSAAVAIASQAMVAAFPLTLVSQDKFFGLAGHPNHDWPVPRGPVHPISLRTYIDPLKLTLLGKDTFFAGAGMGPEYDYPNPRAPLQPSSNRTHLDGSRLTLFGQDVIYGAAGEGVPQRDWPVPRAPTYPSHLRTFTDPFKINLLSRDTFFGPAGMAPRFDYPNPRGPTFPSHLRTYADALKQNLLGKDQFYGGAGQPPANLDWPVPRGRAPNNYYSWPSPNLNLSVVFAVPAPFHLADWPNPVVARDRAGAALRSWNDTWQNIATIGHPPPPNQYDWPNPRGAVYSSELRIFYPSGAIWERNFDQIVDTDILNLPVNVVMAGDVPIKAGATEYDIRPANFRTKTTLSATPARRLQGGRPSFTVKTDKRGYD